MQIVSIYELSHRDPMTVLDMALNPDFSALYWKILGDKMVTVQDNKRSKR